MPPPSYRTPIPDHFAWTMEELWTPALAGMRQLEFQIWSVRHAAQGKALGSPEHSALRRIEDAIAAAWTEHQRRAEWPGPELEFHALVEHARTLRPEVVAGDRASWLHPEQVCQRIRELLTRLGVKPSWRVCVDHWIAERVGLPDARKRNHHDMCRRALLDKRRRERQRLGADNG